MSNRSRSNTPQAQPRPQAQTKAKGNTQGPRVTLAQNIQFRPKGSDQLVTLRAGEEYPVGEGPNAIHPDWIEKLPVLDLAHDANQKGIRQREKILGKIREKQREAEEKGRQAAAQVGRHQPAACGIL